MVSMGQDSLMVRTPNSWPYDNRGVEKGGGRMVKAFACQQVNREVLGSIPSLALSSQFDKKIELNVKVLRMRL